ncbi:hypothetical protein QBC46DRAFT_337896 [Diplogelasinospora grovesii]|uniref:BZIP domain-containing protein n=1 Tax=Diplogelasinospora grovesii TaxID=303347 RepID=A0AAN6S8A4_9PEZI|nr:hypothetical protein QBC46DRAFT_337896 [Diplogelasinospora grovesii]
MSSYQHPQDADWVGVSTDEIQGYLTEDIVDYDDPTTPQQTKPPSLPRSAKSRKASSGKKRRGSQAPQSGSDTEKETVKMPSRSSRHHSSSPGSKGSKSSSKTKTDDWNEVTDPEERRRIQNRIAQRKFREKAREQKDRAQRDAQNQQYAGSSYHIPGPDEITNDGADLSGLPWGSLSMRHVVARGHASASQQGNNSSSRRESSDPSAASPSRPDLDTSSYPAAYLSPTYTSAGGYYATTPQMSSITSYDNSSISRGGNDDSSPYYSYDYDCEYDYEVDATGGGSYHQI